MKTFAIHTLGCRTNSIESAIIEEQLLQSGYKLVNFKDKADLYIINTCTVTAHADNDSKYYARKAKKTNPNAKVALIGCYVQVSKEEALGLDYVDYIFGNNEKLEIAQIIEKDLQKDNVSDIMQYDDFNNVEFEGTSSKTRATIKIQDGCNNRCSYCIIPYARGKSRSNSIENIIKQIKTLCNNSYKEIVISGIHIGLWGQDLKNKKTLLDLFKELEKIESLKRYRVSSLYPDEITDEMIEVFANSKKFANHLHLSLQSVNDKTLKNMNRKYDVKTIFEKVKKLSTAIPNINLGCDIIIGFPNETDKDFNTTFENLKMLNLGYFHVFPYSKRQGTPASIMDNQVNEKVKKERAFILRNLAKEKELDFKNKMTGQSLEVLIEKKRDKSGLLKGISSNFLTVLVNDRDDLKNEIIKVQIINLKNNSLIGKI